MTDREALAALLRKFWAWEEYEMADALIAAGVSFRAEPTLDEGLREAALEVDAMWDAEDGDVIRWQPEAAEALEALRVALAQERETP